MMWVGVIQTPSADAVSLEGCGISQPGLSQEVTAHDDLLGRVRWLAEVLHQFSQPPTFQAGVIYTDSNVPGLRLWDLPPICPQR